MFCMQTKKHTQSNKQTEKNRTKSTVTTTITTITTRKYDSYKQLQAAGAFDQKTIDRNNRLKQKLHSFG